MYKTVVKGEWPSVGRQNGLKGSMNSFSGLLSISLDFIHVLWHDLKNKPKKLWKSEGTVDNLHNLEVQRPNDQCTEQDHAVLAPVHYSMDKCWWNRLRYPLDSDLSGPWFIVIYLAHDFCGPRSLKAR